MKPDFTVVCTGGNLLDVEALKPLLDGANEVRGCFDNDNQGELFLQKLQTVYPSAVADLPPQRGDWADFMQARGEFVAKIANEKSKQNRAQNQQNAFPQPRV